MNTPKAKRINTAIRIPNPYNKIGINFSKNMELLGIRDLGWVVIRFVVAFSLICTPLSYFCILLPLIAGVNIDLFTFPLEYLE